MRVALPKPRHESPCSVEHALLGRRSVREFAASPLAVQDVAQLLWAAQGITTPTGLRTAPSPGALYPLEVLLVAGRVDGLESGVYRYHPAEHALDSLLEADARKPLARAVTSHSCIQEAAAVLAIAGVQARTKERYGSDARRYVLIEAGHAAQNVCLQAVALELGTIVLGAFHAGDVRRILALSRGERAEYLVAVGHPRSGA